MFKLTSMSKRLGFEILESGLVIIEKEAHANGKSLGAELIDDIVNSNDKVTGVYETSEREFLKIREELRAGKLVVIHLDVVSPVTTTVLISIQDVAHAFDGLCVVIKDEELSYEESRFTDYAINRNSEIVVNKYKHIPTIEKRNKALEVMNLIIVDCANKPLIN